MATKKKSSGVWGIDIGQCALKALRCTMGANGDTIVADKFDFIEYPKILSSAEANPEELIEDALRQFLSRNNLVGDKVAICVSGQAGLSRFFKPPPVEISTLPDIVKYEVKQQIPFPIEDVIWDWQQLGGTVVDGRAIDAEVGLFAMKRESVFRALRPFDELEIEIDYVQMSPLAIFNVVCFDMLGKLPDPEDIDPENPPPSTVVMAMGTDTTDLVVTNGLKLWLRNIPIGGNHFTRQLSRELKLTQTKAEHLKRNARQSENPKAVFKAMRPVFNDLVNEVQRSLTFFQSMEKTATISEIILLGNAGKLPGLRQFLNTQLEIEVAKASEFRKLEGDEVIKQSSFTGNILSFGPCYGLCIQALKKGRINTNLLPQEIVVERVIKAKKPWVLAATAAIMFGLVLGWVFVSNSWWRVNPQYADSAGQTWGQSMSKVKSIADVSRSFKDEDTKLKEELGKFNQIAKELSDKSEGKSSWLEIYSALYQALPKDERIQTELASGNIAVDPSQYGFNDRKELYIDHIESVYFKDLGLWYAQVEPIHERMFAKPQAEVADESVASEGDGESLDGGAAEVPTNKFTGKSGWVIEIRGHHFHNSSAQVNSGNAGKSYVLKTLITNLLSKPDVKLPTPNNLDNSFAFSDIGILVPTITRSSERKRMQIVFDPTGLAAEAVDGVGNVGAGQPDFNPRPPLNNPRPGQALGVDADAETKALFDVYVYNFVVQMAWIPHSPEERIAARTARLAAEQANQEQAAGEAAEIEFAP